MVVLPFDPVTPTIEISNQLANSISLIIKISFDLAIRVIFSGNTTPGDKTHNCELYILSEYSPASTTTPSSSSFFYKF